MKTISTIFNKSSSDSENLESRHENVNYLRKRYQQVFTEVFTAVKSRIKSSPKTITELRNTLGLVGYFRRSIPNFSKVANPLYSLLKLHPEKSEKQLLWNSEHQQALDQLLSYLTTPPMLAYPDFNQPFKLYTDEMHRGKVWGVHYTRNKMANLGFWDLEVGPWWGPKRNTTAQN